MTTLSGLILDAGALIAVERGDRRVRLLLDETERAGWRAWYQSARWLRCGAMALGRPHSARFLNATDRVDIVEWDCGNGARRRSAVREGRHLGRGGRLGRVVRPGA
ncbi:MAG: hypothetical protein ACRDRU_08555 [Pseudonocardiaceae bacterium]